MFSNISSDFYFLFKKISNIFLGEDCNISENNIINVELAQVLQNT
jgi:hypothetical protein